MNKRPILCNIFAFILAVIFADAVGLSVIGYAATDSDDYEMSLKRGTVTESFYKNIEEREKRKQSYPDIFLGKLSYQLEFLEKYGGINTEASRSHHEAGLV